MVCVLTELGNDMHFLKADIRVGYKNDEMAVMTPFSLSFYVTDL